MTEPTNNPLFDNAPGGANDPQLPDSIARASEQDRVQTAKKWLQDGLDRLNVLANSHGLPRAQQFLPYLLVRAQVKDNGARPLPAPMDRSPDIWIVQGDPSSAPGIPPNQGPAIVSSGGHYTIYAHVWNLGRAPTVGVKIEFYATNVYAGRDPGTGDLLGLARVDLPPRNSLACHKLVKCPKAWTPLADQNNLDMALRVRVSAIGDPIGTKYRWDSANNRHVACRVIGVQGP